MRVIVNVKEAGQDDIRYSVDEGTTIVDFVEDTLGSSWDSSQVKVDGEIVTDPDFDLDENCTVQVSTKKYTSGNGITA